MRYRLIKIQDGKKSVYRIQKLFLFFWVQAKTTVHYNSDRDGSARLMPFKLIFTDENQAFFYLNHLKSDRISYYKAHKIIKVYSTYLSRFVFVDMSQYTGNQYGYEYAPTLFELHRKIDNYTFEPITTIIG